MSGPRAIQTVTGAFVAALAGLLALAPARAEGPVPGAQDVLQKLDSPRGICAILGDSQAGLAVALARASELVVYVQLADAKDVQSARKAVQAAGLLNRRVYVEQGSDARIHLADNLADAVIAVGAAQGRVAKEEALRVLRPGGKAWLGPGPVEKPQPAGTDEWSHPYHGPDNNPQSMDRLARAPYLTQFLAEPWYCPMPEMTVASGGRLFKVFGSRAFLRPQWPVLNTLIAMNAYNGTLLWKRPLDPEFMIHRNTLIATPDTLYLADGVSCKLLDAATGRVKDEIQAPADLSDGPAWKWIALEGGVLYALVGEKEPPGDALKGTGYRGAGWPWWQVPKYRWGFGRTILAIDPASKKVLWHHREEDPIDTRALCMKDGRIYFYSHRKFLGCLEAKTGKIAWKTGDPALLEAIGEHHPAQFPATGFATSAYMKCGTDALYFAGPQRTKLVAASTKDGKLLWQYPEGAYQLLIRDDGLYAMGAQQPSQKFDPLTGKSLLHLMHRAGCTRATGSVDRIFVRGGGDGTFSFDTASQKVLPISPMRPACHDGVVISDGHLYWGPWMCGCNLSLIGVVCLGPAGDFDFSQKAAESDRLQSVAAESEPAGWPAGSDGDWPTYRRDNARSTRSPQSVPAQVRLLWTHTPESPVVATSPVAAGGLVLVGGSDGVVRAVEAADGKPRWSFATGGAIRVPPAVVGFRTLVGSADGWVYALYAGGGQLLWRFRAAPVERKIAVYGGLQSTWPVASGVLVENGVAYAAAGIANYDGTHVYALDAATGEIRWQNNTSGITEGGQGSGVSVQGDLLLANGRLYLAGGNRVPLASYDLADGRFQAVRPAPVGPDRRGPRGHDLFLRKNGALAVSNRLPWYTRPEDLHYIDYAELAAGPGTIVVTTGDVRLDAPGQPDPAKATPLWSARPLTETAAAAVASNAVVLAGVDGRVEGSDGAETETYALTALDVRDGKPLWRHALPAGPVAWGLAIDREGRVLVALRDGRVLCFAAAEPAGTGASGSPNGVP